MTWGYMPLGAYTSDALSRRNILAVCIASLYGRHTPRALLWPPLPEPVIRKSTPIRIGFRGDMAPRVDRFTSHPDARLWIGADIGADGWTIYRFPPDER